MNINEFKGHDIIDPNLARKYPGSQENPSSIDIVDPNLRRSHNIVTPQEMGFTHKQPEYAPPEQGILDRMDGAITRRRKEATIMANAIEESDGEGVSEEEFQDLLVQNQDIINDSFPEIPEDSTIPTPELNKTYDFPQSNPASNLINELENDVDNEEVESLPEDNNSPVITENLFSNFESGDIDFDDEEDEEEQDDKEKEQQEQLDKLKYLIREKIKPVTEAFDISTFTISNRPASSSVSTPRVDKEKIADWALMNSQQPIYMRRFTGTELERLQNGGKGRTRLNRAMDTWNLIYNHIENPYKPASLEEWAKVTSFLDIDHIYMAIYRANFEGTNYIPYNCTNPNCKEKIFLSDNFDIMDMCKFASKEAKAKFESILDKQPTAEASQLYHTEVVPVSDDYAFVFKEPSIYDIVFESAVLDQEFVDKFGDLVSICTYIDKIYYINKQEKTLQPIRVNVYANNMKKTIKAKIKTFSQIISSLNSDQYNTLLAYMQKINTTGNELTYQLPEVTCPHCKTTIKAVQQDAQSMVFTRHQLGALAIF